MKTITATIDAVLAAERARADALRRGDATALAALLSDDLRYTHSNGRFQTKADVLNGFTKEHVSFERFEERELHAASLTDDVVVVTGRIDQCRIAAGKRSEGKLLFQGVWRLEEAAWRLVSLQTAMLPA